jgi:hypothetical protein
MLLLLMIIDMASGYAQFECGMSLAASKIRPKNQQRPGRFYENCFRSSIMAAAAVT